MDDILRFYAEERERRPRHEKGFRTEHCETLLSIKLSIKVGLRCVYTNYYEVFNVMKSTFYSSRVKNVQKGRFFIFGHKKKFTSSSHRAMPELGLERGRWWQGSGRTK